MATIQVAGRHFDDIQIIICDKDGTLVAFDVMWGNWIKSWIDRLIDETKSRHELDIEALTANLDRTLGFDRSTTNVVPESPVAVSTMGKIYAVAMAVLYQEGLAWHAAEEVVGAMTAEPLTITQEMVQPLGDVKGAFEKWIEAGMKVIVATSDDRSAAVAATEIMDVHHLITEYFCGDDQIANKPNPEAIHLICEKYQVKPNQMLMVGDSASDMAFGRNGELAGVVAIAEGGDAPTGLAEAADVVVDSVDKMIVVAK